MNEEAGYFAVSLAIFFLLVLAFIVAVFRGIRKDTLEYDKQFLWDRFELREDQEE